MASFSLQEALPGRVSSGGLTAGLRRISQEILAHHGALLSTPKGHQELLLALRQGYVIWSNPLHTCPCRDRRGQRLLSDRNVAPDG